MCEQSVLFCFVLFSRQRPDRFTVVLWEAGGQKYHLAAAAAAAAVVVVVGLWDSDYQKKKRDLTVPQVNVKAKQTLHFNHTNLTLSLCDRL
jgi:hypothetical protein